jgi:hypothetical protein
MSQQNQYQKIGSNEMDSLKNPFGLSDTISPFTESSTRTIGHISFDVKLPGKRSAGKSHAAFDEAGDGDGING